MFFLGLGLLLLALKWLAIGPVAAWDWWIVLSPFALAVMWWSWTDWSGHDKRREMEKMDKRKQDRIDKNRAALTDPGKRRR
jgi:small Trp-rich protein